MDLKETISYVKQLITKIDQQKDLPCHLIPMS